MRATKAFVFGLVVMPLTLLGIAVAVASNVTVQNTFVPGERASSKQVNQNFTALASAINDNDARLRAAEGAVGAVQAQVDDMTVNGAIKAAAYIDGGVMPFVVRSFNNAGPTPTVAPVPGIQGLYIVDFGFDLTDRFWSVEIVGSGGTAGMATSNWDASSSSSIAVFTHTSDGYFSYDFDFYVFVY